MTTDDATIANARPGPSVHVVRARKLLYGGLVGGVSASAICLVVFGLLAGARGVASAALAAGLVLFFYVIGQLVMVLAADTGARMLLAISMLSYTTRVAALGLVLLIFSRFRDHWPAIDPLTVFVTTIAVVAGWLIVEVVVFTRLRISIYDTPYVSPENPEDSAVPADPARAGDAR